MKHLYTRLTMTIPGAGKAIHLADLEESGSDCLVHRMIALTPDEVIAGAARVDKPGTNAEKMHRAGQIDVPKTTVPHPDTYGDYPDITTQHLSRRLCGLVGRSATAFPRTGLTSSRTGD